MAPAITVHNTTAQTKKQKKPPDTIHKWFPYTQYSIANDNKLQSQKTRHSVKKGTIFPVFLVPLAPYSKRAAQGNPTDRQTDRELARQADRQTDRQTDRQLIWSAYCQIGYIFSQHVIPKSEIARVIRCRWIHWADEPVYSSWIQE